MTHPVSARVLPLAFTLFIALGAHAAHADCVTPLSDFDDAYCAARDYPQSDMLLNMTYQKLYQTLDLNGQEQLRHAELAWIRRRDSACTIERGNGVFINFDCATRLTKDRLSELQSELSVPVFPAAYNGEYVVQGSAMPWLWTANGLNSAFAFGAQDGTGPTTLLLSRLNAHTGDRLVIRYEAGRINTGFGARDMDAGGFANFDANGANGITGKPLPNRYMSPYPINVGALVGAFTDHTGEIVGTPFAIGDGPVEKPVPAGATRLQLGINDDRFTDNGGSLTVSITVQAAGSVQGRAAGAHGCAVFGASAGTACTNYPDWVTGMWQPPAGGATLHVLAVGGGGAGSYTLVRGIGGPGGASGAVVTGSIISTAAPVAVTIGQGGAGGNAFERPGADGMASSFGDIIAAGGGGGQTDVGGSTQGAGGSSGGGGGGGGNYQAGLLAGKGAAGGTAGGDGGIGQTGSGQQRPVSGLAGGPGAAFPSLLGFHLVTITPGLGGAGGGTSGSDGAGCGGGGGGGGGGVLLNNAGPTLAPNPSGPYFYPCQNDHGENGANGTGYGAGGGGAGNGSTQYAGSGAPGVIYVEW